MQTQTKTSMSAGQLIEKAFLKMQMTGKIVVMLLLLFCLPISVRAQKTINLNSESTDFHLNSQKMSVQANIPSEYLKEAKEARFFTINPALQRTESVNVGDKVNLQLFEDKNYTATISNIVTDVNGTLALTLRLPDYPLGFAIITTSREGKSLVTVSVPELGQSFGSRYNVNSNVNYLIEIDESKIERPHFDDDAVTIPEAIEILGNEGLQNVKNLAPQLKSSQADNCGPAHNTNTGAPATISLLIVYTPAAAASEYVYNHGGINNVIALMIALGNTCFSNSETGITLTLAHSAEVSYTETDMTTSLNCLQNTLDGYMDNVHALRKQYSADLVQLLSTDAGGGLGYTLNNPIYVDNGRYEYGFSVCNVTQVADDYPCSVHEIGHNMGLGHGVQHVASWANGIFDYSYGYRWTGTTTVNMGGINTNLKGSVMTYWSGSNYSDNTPCYNVPYFSNPDVNFEGATGTNSSIGPNNKQADAARSLREMKHVIAFYSDRLPNLPDAPTNIVVSSPTDYGATFSWDACANATKYRVCHPTGDGYSYTTTTNTTCTVNNPDLFPSLCTNYEFFIMALNECGDAASSATLTFTTKCTTDPTVETSAADGITTNSATLHKTVTAANGTAVTAQGFKYKETSSPTWLTSADGNLTGLTAGTQYKFYAYATTELGTFNGKVLNFTTTAAIPVSGITIDPSDASFTSIGETYQLTATVEPDNATDKTVTWSSSNPSVATVSQEGLVTAAAGCGTTEITVTTNDGNYTATCVVTNLVTITWNGSVSTDWDNPSNWDENIVPNAAHCVVISGTATRFPKLDNDASVKTIRFEYGAQLGGQDKLVYEKAFVEYDFNRLSRGRWYMLSVPLQETYPGDFYFGGYPKAWLRNFAINGGMADWQTAYSSTTPLTTGTGFIYWLDAQDGTNDRGLQLSGGILRLPFFDSKASGVDLNVHYQHDFDEDGASDDFLGTSEFFVHQATTGDNAFERDEDSYTVLRHTSAYRLAGAIVDAPLSFAGENGRIAGQMAIVGNPFMSTLSFDQLYTSNNTKIKAGYQIWAGDYAVAGYHGYNDVGGGFGIVATSDLDEYIAPLQAFIVEKSDTYSAGDKLNFNISATQTGGGQLRSATAETGNKLEIIAANSAGAYRIFIAQREGGSNTLSDKDSRILMNSVSELPVVYTLKPSEEGIAYAGANIIPAGNSEIPLGLLTTYSGELKFTFTGMDSYNSNIVLVDKATGKETDLTGKTAFDYTFRHTPESQNGQTAALNDRFLLRITSNVTGMEEVSRSIYIYSQGSDIRVISGSPIKSVMAYNLQGAMVRVSHTDVVRDLAPGIYLVRVITETDSKAAKVIVKN